MTNLPRPLTEEQAAEEAANEYGLHGRLALAESREEARITEEAQKLMEDEDVRKQHPDLTFEDAKMWAEVRNSFIYHANATLEEARNLTKGRNTSKRLEMAPWFEKHVGDAREKAKVILKEKAEADKESREVMQKKVDEFLSKLRNIDSLRDNDQEMQKLQALANEIHSERDNIGGEALGDIYEDGEEILREATKKNLLNLQLLIIMLGGQKGREELVDMAYIVEELIVDSVEKGGMAKAREISGKIRGCRHFGYTGPSYFNRFGDISGYEKALRKGYKKCLQKNDATEALAFQEEARKNGIDLSKVESNTETQLDLEGLRNGIPFAS